MCRYSSGSAHLHFDPHLRQRAISRLQIESDLRLALQQDQFLLHYQPIFSLVDKTIVGLEALLRWDDPNYQAVSPAEFIPIAEESGLIVEIGRWVLREACDQVKSWQVAFPHEPPLEINVNVAAKQFYQPDFVERIADLLQETGIAPGTLILEITERVFMDQVSVASTVFDQLCALGVRLQIDDFGTGYSSLGYIHRYPIHTIKIDQSFIRGLGASKRNTDVVRAMIQMAQDLGMSTVAEGIETEGQLLQLSEFGCGFGQGFLLSRPLSPEHVVHLLRGREATPLMGSFDARRENGEQGCFDHPMIDHPGFRARKV